MYYPTKAETYFLTKQEKQVNIMAEDYTIKEVDGINVMVYRNTSVISTHRKEANELKVILRKMVNIKFYKNFIIVNGKTFNGWTKELIDKLIVEMYKPLMNKISRNININDFEFED